MARRLTLTLILALAAASLAACSGDDDPRLMNVRSSGTGPDEFAILPGKPLQQPPSLASLPTPTPGGTNRTDPTPQADAIAALGGNPRAAAPTDPALLRYTARMGVAPGIRRQLAQADLEYRRENNGRFLERLFNTNVYFDAYEPFQLDKYRELRRMRAAGVRTPQAPPPPFSAQ